MMLYRRKLVLNLVKYAGCELSLVQLHKLMFLVSKRIESSSYDFIPDKYGCYSMVLHSDIHALAESGLLTYKKGESPFETRVGISRPDDAGDLKLKKDDMLGMSAVLRLAPYHDIDALLLDTYRMRPLYAVNSELLCRFKDDAKLMEDVEDVRRKIAGQKRGLYTIGYEGYTLDGFMRDLMVKNVKTLVDVRKNPFSMRREFCGGFLEKSLEEVGIRYISMPQVGIPSENRKEMIPEGRTKELFAWYVSDVLPGCSEYAGRIAGYVADGNTAVMCYEANPEDCHRSLFASYCLRSHPEIGEIITIRNREKYAEKSTSDGANLSLSFA